MTEPTLSKLNQRLSRRRAPWAKIKVTCHRGALGLGPNLALGVLDLSESGARLLVKDALQPQRVVSLGLAGPSNAQPLTRLGTVVWSVPAADGTHCVGVSLHTQFDYQELTSLT